MLDHIVLATFLLVTSLAVGNTIDTTQKGKLSYGDMKSIEKYDSEYDSKMLLRMMKKRDPFQPPNKYMFKSH